MQSLLGWLIHAIQLDSDVLKLYNTQMKLSSIARYEEHAEFSASLKTYETVDVLPFFSSRLNVSFPVL